MDSYSYNDVISIIANKKVKYITQTGDFPNVIEISKKLLIFLKINILAIMNVPTDEIKTIYGMKVKINDYIDAPEEVKVYYKKEMVNNAVEKSSTKKMG